MECDPTRNVLAPRNAVYFNQRTRMECDCNTLALSQAKVNFNQRTRMECDCNTLALSQAKVNFNQRTRMECDGDVYRTNLNSQEFQSTHSHGVRLCV